MVAIFPKTISDQGIKKRKNTWGLDWPGSDNKSIIVSQLVYKVNNSCKIQPHLSPHINQCQDLFSTSCIIWDIFQQFSLLRISDVFFFFTSLSSSCPWFTELFVSSKTAAKCSRVHLQVNLQPHTEMQQSFFHWSTSEFRYSF